MATIGVRYIYALPFAWLYLWWLLDYRSLTMPSLNQQFLHYAVIACVMQIMGTLCLMAAFKYHNFAVATSLAKTEAIQVAVFGALLFSASLTFIGWISVIIGVVGVLLVSKLKFTFKDFLQNPGAGFGLVSGLSLAITTLLIRQSSLALNSDLLLSAAVTLTFMITVQSIIFFIYIYCQDKRQFFVMVSQWRLCLFVGITSVIGSIGWFTAASFQNAAYVKALGQVEFFITLFITYRIFKEKISPVEYLGMLLIIVSVLVLLLWA
tara:strand:- start:52 stop:846 length:795 start_codon:yes stop_codon:yes gene_type:complete